MSVWPLIFLIGLSVTLKEFPIRVSEWSHYFKILSSWLVVLYTQDIIYMHIYTYRCRIHIDAMIKTSEDFFKKIYLSLYLKGLCVWERVGDRTKTATYWPPQPIRTSPCVVLALLGCSTGGPGAQLSAECWLSAPHLVTNGSSNSIGGPVGPFCRVVAFSTTSCL